MLFNSYIFVLLFLPAAVAGYYWLHHMGWKKAALGYLIMMSMVFYGYNSIQYLVILVISILANYLLVRLMDRSKGSDGRKFCMAAGLLYNLGVLFCFKYYDFFIGNVNAALGADFHFLRLALPLGISFYTFQQLSYVIDSYRGDCERYSLMEYAAYVSFFPQLVAGPIVYHDELIPQLRDERNHVLNYENLSRGIYAFALGLAKKVLVADTFSKVVVAGYADVGKLGCASAVLVMVSYSLQIYFDFSGYCDMAYGIGYMFNVELPVNFNSPYKAASVREFWDRWHMTLTRFFTKYVYIPLGGSRRGKVRTYVNVMIVFCVSGIWHGANWTFILWGVVNGLGNLFDRLFDRILQKIPHVVRVAGTFCFCTIAWSLFRADSIGQARQLWHQLKVPGDGSIYGPLTSAVNELTEMKILYRIGLGWMEDMYPWAGAVLFVLVILSACFFMRNTQEKVRDMRYTVPRMAAVVALMVWSILSLSDISEFLYFNF